MNKTLTNKLQKWHRFVSPDGKRQDSAHQYIHPLLQDGQHPNLHILVNSKVIRILFDSSLPSRAIGIEYSPNADKQPSLSLSKPVYKTIQARKLVVIAAGALGTPQILERSGLGNPKYLKPLGIPVISDLPGVGENYQDHQLVLYPYKTSLNKRETLDGILSGRQDLAKLIEQKDPILGWNGIGCAHLPFLPQDLTNILRRLRQTTPLRPRNRRSWSLIYERLGDAFCTLPQQTGYAPRCGLRLPRRPIACFAWAVHDVGNLYRISIFPWFYPHYLAHRYYRRVQVRYGLPEP